MNRIILIGNGFDLAHGMSTSYKNFLEDYWKNKIDDMRNYQAREKYRTLDFEIYSVPNLEFVDSKYKELRKLINLPSKIVFENRFLEIISEKTFLNNWVDIENEYYSLMLELIKIDENHDVDSSYSILNLNKDFDRIRDLLQSYLLNEEVEFNKEFKNNNLKNNIGSKIYSEFKIKDFSLEFINEIVDSKRGELIMGNKSNISNVFPMKTGVNLSEFSKIGSLTYTEMKKEIRKFFASNSIGKYFNMIPSEILFLNFNYTSNESHYLSPSDFISGFEGNLDVIHIHGDLREPQTNPVVFGFGDEIDENYKSLEGLNDNRFLENIKSIKYLETDNYKKLIEFVNSEKYQIFIFGHSCGNSDRTLLNTLFEHKNCVSIKPFFYQIDENNDNYSDIVRNISRNFKDKVKMRNIVVNKRFCERMA